MLMAVNNLNILGFVHLDIKLENFLIDDKFNIVLSDFGCANVNIDTNYLAPLYQTVGTNKYISPEVDINYYNNKADVWSIGICLYMLLTGNILYKDISEYLHSDDTILLTNHSAEINDLLNQLLIKSPSERISCNEALNHKFFC